MFTPLSGHFPTAQRGLDLLARLLVGTAFLRVELLLDDFPVEVVLGRNSTSDFPLARLAEELILFQPAMLSTLTP